MAHDAPDPFRYTPRTAPAPVLAGGWLLVLAASCALFLALVMRALL